MAELTISKQLHEHFFRILLPVAAFCSWGALLYLNLIVADPMRELNSNGLLIGQLCLLLYFISLITYNRLKKPFILDQHIVGHIRGVLYTGLIVLGFALALKLIAYVVAISSLESKSLFEVSIQRLNDGLIGLFLVRTFYIWKGLVLYKANKTVRGLWNFFEIYLIFTLSLIFLPLSFYSVYTLGLLSIPLLLIVIVSFNLKWVAYLSLREKWEAILLFIITGIILFYFYTLLSKSGGGTLVDLRPEKNSFILLLFAFIGFYSLVSVLVSLFNLPTSEVVERKIIEASSLQALGRNINKSEREEELYEVFLEAAMKVSNTTNGFFEVKDDSGLPITAILKGKDTEKINQLRLHLQQRHLPNIGYEVLRLDKMQNGTSHNGYKSVLLVSLNSSKGTIGTLGIINEDSSYFEKEAVETTVSLSGQTAISIQKFRLEKESIHNERYRQELEVARRVQRQFLPRALFAGEEFEVAILNHTADEVGGDYYDIVPLNEKECGLIMADVSGKGTTAAFNMAQLRGVFYSFAQDEVPTDGFLMLANQALSRCLDPSSFVTAVYGRLHRENNTFSYARAGHCPIIYYRHSRKTAIFLDGDGLGLGIVRTKKYRDFVSMHEITLEESDKLIFYTDGIVEAKSPNGEEYGYQRLINEVEKRGRKTSKELITLLEQHLLEFTQNQNVNDDYSFMVIGANRKSPQ